MREILFRGKQLDRGEWVEGWYEMYPFGKWPVKTSIIPSEEAKDGHYEHVQVDPSTVGQYTGMKDKNGKRIFEGDVAKVLQGKDKDIAYVGFENGAFMLYPKTGNIYERTLWEYWYNDWDVEVIGNITDNPEFLEK